MGTPREPQPTKLFVAVTFALEERLRASLLEMCEAFGALDLKSKVFAFDYTDYYLEEMGSPLYKQFVAFAKLIPPEALAEVKRATNRIEERFRSAGKRTVNLDPGYVDAARVVLATTKDYDHRVYLQKGIFADVHLRFRHTGLAFNPWTYPDYKSAEAQDFFLKLRELYLGR